MNSFTINYAGHEVAIAIDSEEVLPFLDIILGKLKAGRNNKGPTLHLTRSKPGHYRLHEEDKTNILYEGVLNLKLSSMIYDRVIFHLLNSNDSGVALHAAAVAIDNHIAIIPGKSGAGKSTLTAWLTAHGFTYLTDELVFVPFASGASIVPFARPINLKGKAVSVMKRFYDDQEFLLSENSTGCLLGGNLQRASLKPKLDGTLKPKVIIFPKYSILSPISTRSITSIRASGLMLECAANIRNLGEEGFNKIVDLSKKLPAHEVRYGCLEELNDSLGDIIADLCRTSN